MSSEPVSLLRPGEEIKPILDDTTARKLVETRYGLKIRNIIELLAYDDKNYRIICDEDDENTMIENAYINQVPKSGYVLKVVNSLDSRDTGFIEAQTELLLYLNERGVVCPYPIRQRDGSFYSVEVLGMNGDKPKRHVIRLLVFRNGEVLSKSRSVTKTLLEKIGYHAAYMDNLLKGFEHPAYEARTSLWALSAAPKLRDFMFALDNKSDIGMIDEVIRLFEDQVLSRCSSFEEGIIHGDLNADNIIVRDNEDRVEALIDFADSHKSCLFFELAICICYMIIHCADIEVAKPVIEGYQKQRLLTPLEKKVLKTCVCARFAQTIVIGAYSYKIQPDNQYIINLHEVKWKMLRKLWPMEEDVVWKLWGLHQQD